MSVGGRHLGRADGHETARSARLTRHPAAPYAGTRPSAAPPTPQWPPVRRLRASGAGWPCPLAGRAWSRR
eukprot:scaffold83173_cov76-Phaeocystis_antarctica.AAC.4